MPVKQTVPQQNEAPDKATRTFLWVFGITAICGGTSYWLGSSLFHGHPVIENTMFAICVICIILEVLNYFAFIMGDYDKPSAPEPSKNP